MWWYIPVVLFLLGCWQFWRCADPDRMALAHGTIGGGFWFAALASLATGLLA